MEDSTERLKSIKIPPTSDIEHFSIEKYIEHKNSKSEYAKKFGNIKPGLLIGTNIKFKGREDA